jgi:hypothetical protein
VRRQSGLKGGFSSLELYESRARASRHSPWRLPPLIWRLRSTSTWRETGTGVRGTRRGLGGENSGTQKRGFTQDSPQDWMKGGLEVRVRHSSWRSIQRSERAFFVACSAVAPAGCRTRRYRSTGFAQQFHLVSPEVQFWQETREGTRGAAEKAGRQGVYADTSTFCT